MPITLVSYILAACLSVSGINLFLIYKRRLRSTFHQFLVYFNLYAAIHVAFVIIVNEFFSDKIWLDQCAPFSLAYAPMLYFASIAMSEKPIPQRVLFRHLALPALFFVHFLYRVIAVPPVELAAAHNHLFHFYAAGSFFFYVFLSMRPDQRPATRVRKLLLFWGAILIIFVGMVELAVILSGAFWWADPVPVSLIRALIYSTLFICLAFIFRYLMADTFYKIYLYEEALGQNQVDPDLEQRREKTATETLNQTTSALRKYEKSLLSENQLDEYAAALAELMQEQKVYLDTELSLQKLAQQLRIPSHHLTQVMNLRLNVNFYDYINGYRIDHACALMRQEQSLNLESLAVASGFNSKVSFNRNFKNRMGCTPSSYRDTLNK